MTWLLIVKYYKQLILIGFITVLGFLWLHVKSLELTIKEQSITISQLNYEKNKLLISYNNQKRDFEQVEQKLKQYQQHVKTKIIKIEETKVSPICDESIKYLKQESSNIQWE